MDIKQIKTQLSRAGLQQRESQLETIEAIYKAIKRQEIICVEAPTGTGKTVSYGIASYLAKAKKQTIIISTSTIALQEQLIKKDLPLITRILDKDINYTIAKGRRHYVCHSRLYSPNWATDMFTSKDDIESMKTLLERRQWYGDRDELDISIDEQTWRQVSTDASGCSRKVCEFFEDCAFFNARKKIHRADIIVVNHSLLLSDLELGGGAILPEPEKSIYIIDECHHLPDKALDHFAKSDTLLGTVDWINNLTKTLTNAIKLELIKESAQDNINTATKTLVQTLTSMHAIVDANQAQFKDDMWRIKEIPSDMLDLAQDIAKLSFSITAQLESIVAELEAQVNQKNLTTEEKNTQGKILSSIEFATSLAENLFETWDLFCHQRQAKEAPVARWFEKRGDAYFCHASPINISKKLKELFWDKAENGVVLCSATVRALGEFKNFRRRTGLLDIENYAEKLITTGFDYQQSVLYIPNMQHEPAGMNQDAHRREVIELLPELLLPKTGTLVLFTSQFAMRETFDAMPDHCAKDILVQSRHNKHKLIEKHKKRIQRGKRSVIFGLASFGEGLDLPADFCQHVIIHKLPFAVPSTPIEQTRNEWLASNQLSAFMLSSLPNASIRLTQYVGRLIRQEDDIGIVSILDKRLYSKQYGAFLLENLPNFHPLINADLAALKSHQSTRELWD